MQAQEAGPEGSIRETGADSVSLVKSKRDQDFSWGFVGQSLLVIFNGTHAMRLF
jgi:hypothetical protein